MSYVVSLSLNIHNFSPSYPTQTKGHIVGYNPVVDVVFTFCYPRIDIEVSKQLHHLLKSPFCIHPGTRMYILQWVECMLWHPLTTTERVCVPINPDKCLDFNLSSCPKLPVLIKEVNDFLDAQAKKEDSTNNKRAGKN